MCGLTQHLKDKTMKENKVIFFTTIDGKKQFVSGYITFSDGSSTISLTPKKEKAAVLECGHTLAQVFPHVSHNPKKWYVKAIYKDSKSQGYLGKGVWGFDSWGKASDSKDVFAGNTRQDAVNFLAEFLTHHVHQASYNSFDIVEE
jgi:hypothetical protein